MEVKTDIKIDRSYFDDIEKNIAKKLTNKKVQAGWFGNDRYPPRVTYRKKGRALKQSRSSAQPEMVRKVAYVQEMGTYTNPARPRPFMQITAEKNHKKWSENFAKEVEEALEKDGDLSQALTRLGLAAAADITETISALWTPPLKQSTIEARKLTRKESALTGIQTKSLTKPLVDTGYMVRSIRSRVVER